MSFPYVTLITGGYNLVKNNLGRLEKSLIGIRGFDPRLNLTLTISVADAPVQETVEKYCQLRGIHDVQPWLDGVEAWLPRSRMIWQCCSICSLINCGR
ncbi:hypothetical protein OH492_19835 [Vibrio chagasii]|nr:hypothetical protein [Vibrio chagasii]